MRSGLAEKGVTLDLRLAQYYQNVVSGGKDTGGGSTGEYNSFDPTPWGQIPGCRL